MVNQHKNPAPSGTQPKQTKPSSTAYNPLTHGLLSLLPSQWVPYAELIRIQKPAGILHVYLPYLFGSLLGACISADYNKQLQLARPPSSSHHFLWVNIYLLAIAFTARSVGCTWNDIVDRDLDKHVERCKIRPMARGALSVPQAVIFMIAQYGILFSLVYIFSSSSTFQVEAFTSTTASSGGSPLAVYIVPVVIVGNIYPFAKRFTNYAQLVLGIAHSLNTYFGCRVVGVDLVSLFEHDALRSYGVALVTLAASYAVWVMLSDTIYAFQDLEGDKKLGNLSMSVRFERVIRPVLYGLAVLQLGLLCITGWFAGMGLWFFGSAVGMTGLVLLSMVFRVRLESAESCWWWFQNGGLMVGVTMTCGLLAECMKRTPGLIFEGLYVLEFVTTGLRSVRFNYYL